MISALTLLTNLIKGNKLGVEVHGILACSKEDLAEALAIFLSVDNAGALVNKGELAKFKDGVLPSFNKEVATVVKGEEVMALRPEEQGTQQLFVNTSKIPKGEWGPHLMEEDGCHYFSQSREEVDRCTRNAKTSLHRSEKTRPGRKSPVWER